MPSLTAYILTHWMFGFKYFTVSLLLHYRGALPHSKEIALKIVNMVGICFITLSSVLYGAVKWRRDFYPENSLWYIHLSLRIISWALFFCLCMSLLTLAGGLLLIRRTLKDASHLMVNERYMALHLIFLLLAVSTTAVILVQKENSSYYYLYWMVNLLCDFASALILAYIFA